MIFTANKNICIKIINLLNKIITIFAYMFV